MINEKVLCKRLHKNKRNISIAKLYQVCTCAHDKWAIIWVITSSHLMKVLFIFKIKFISITYKNEMNQTPNVKVTFSRMKCTIESSNGNHLFPSKNVRLKLRCNWLALLMFKTINSSLDIIITKLTANNLRYNRAKCTVLRFNNPKTIVNLNRIGKCKAIKCAHKWFLFINNYYLFAMLNLWFWVSLVASK